MKKKLSLLLAVLMALTMVIGTGVTALADSSGDPVPPPEGCPDSVHECSVERVFCVVYLYAINPDDPYPYKIAVYNHVNGKYSYRDAILSTEFNDAPQIGKFYHRSEGTGFQLCDDNNPKPSPQPQPTSQLCEPSSPAHTHDFHWETIVELTKDNDGLEQEVCPCGAVRNIQKISAYGFTLTEYATPLVVNAKPGQNVEMDFGEFNSFPKSFMEKVADKTQQNVSFGFHYNWQHERQEIKIPAGTLVDTNFDWYGPAKMQELYGMN